MDMENLAFRRAIAETDHLLRDGYVPLGATVDLREVGARTAIYRLRYRSWWLEIALRARATPLTTLATEFTCTMVRRGRLGRFSRAATRTGLVGRIVGPVLLGSPSYEGCAEALAAVYDKVIHKRSVQRALRRTGPVST